MAPDLKTTRRMNRKHVLEALHAETGSWGGDVAEDRVRAYCDAPTEATREEFAYVGALTLRRFYVDPAKPNTGERASLWKSISQRLNKQAKDPGGWDSETNVSQLQAIAEEA